jgi:hypothetical protein
MGESFGSSVTIVEVTADDLSPSEPKKQLWIALAKPSQALTLVLAAVPEGWTAELLVQHLTEEQQRTLEGLNLKPGDVYRLTSKRGRLARHNGQRSIGLNSNCTGRIRSRASMVDSGPIKSRIKRICARPVPRNF